MSILYKIEANPRRVGVWGFWSPEPRSVLIYFLNLQIYNYLPPPHPLDKKNTYIHPSK